MKAGSTREVLDAIARSSLNGLPEEVIDRLTDGAVLRDIAGGTRMHDIGEAPFTELVVVGLIRGFVSAPNGRTMTIRYCRPGALMGTATLFNERSPRTHGSTSALVDSRVLALRPATMQAIAARDILVTRALLREASARVAEYMTELEASSFASLRQ